MQVLCQTDTLLEISIRICGIQTEGRIKGYFHLEKYCIHRKKLHANLFNPVFFKFIIKIPQ